MYSETVYLGYILKMGEIAVGSGSVKKVRKDRSDRKIDVKPTVSIELKDCIYRLSYITDTPVQFLVEHICEHGVISRKVIENLSKHFQRTVRLNNTLFMGGLDSPAITKKDLFVETGRIHTRFSKLTHENISTLAYALNVTPTRAAAVLLETTIKQTDLVNVFVRAHLSKELNESRMSELKKVLRYINANNSDEETYSWFAFLSNFIDEIKDTASTVSQSLQDFLDKWKSL